METDARKARDAKVARGEALRRAAAERYNADRAFRRAICDAHEDGWTMRDIAFYTGVSHQRVHQIIREEA